MFTNNSSRESAARVSSGLQYGVMLFSGVYIGWSIGGFITEFLFLMFIQKAPYEWGEIILSSLSGSHEFTQSSIAEAVSSVVLMGRFGIAMYIGFVLIHGQKMFVEILRIKLTHRIVTFALRYEVAEEFNIFADYLWAVTYCISNALIPATIFLTLFFIGISIVPATLQFTYAVMAGLTTGILGASKATEIVYEILYPHRLIREIEMAPQFIQVMQQRAEEERKRRELDRGKGNDL